MSKTLTIVALSLSIIGVAGCGANNAGEDRNGTMQINQTESYNQRSLRVESSAEENIERMAEVDEAHVIIANNDAYVAVRLADDNNRTARNTRSNGNRTGREGTNIMGGIGGNGVGGTGERRTDGIGRNTGTGTMDGTNLGTYGTGRRNGNGNGNGAGASYGAGNGTNTGTARLYGQSGGGGNGQGYTQVSNKFEQQIADQVREANRDINNVYVSVDSGFFDQMTGYAHDIRDGGNRNGLFNDFNNTVRGLFR